MLIAFAFSFIGILIIFGSYKPLRHRKTLLLGLLLTAFLAAAGTYIILSSDIKNPYFLMGLISPFVALVILEVTRLVYLRTRGQEIILYLGGFLPKRFEERFVSRLEKFITFWITATAMVIPYLIINLLI